MSNYKVTVHEHKIYDLWVEANSKEEAEELASDTVIEGDRRLWSLDENASWVELGDIYEEDEEE